MGATLLLSSCFQFPQPVDDDESHASFAREVIPALLGRKPWGVDEVEVVADIAELYGRETAVVMLMKDEAFVDHWSDVLVDLLRIQRDRTGGIGVAQDQSCWGEPTRATPDASIATWVRDHAPGDAGAPSPAWNMSDLLRSAIVLDDLSPLYRANLFTLSMRRAGSNGRRTQITDHFLETYLNRNITCLRCHNPTYSASNKVDGGGNIVWRRTWTIPGHPEKALFGNYLDGAAANSRVQFVMRGDIRQPQAGGIGTRPWGMTDSCITDTSSPLPANNGTVTHTGFKAAGTTNYPSAGFGSLDGSTNPKVSLWELEAALRQGVLDLQDGYQRFPASGPLLPPDEELYCDLVQVFSAKCTGCHSGGFPSAEMDLSASDLGPVLINVPVQGPNSTNTFRVVPNNTAQSELFRRVDATTDPPRMPLAGGGLPAGEITTHQDWVNAGAATIDSSNCVASTIPDVHPDEAFAFLTATNLVDGIWMATMGSRLTIDNGFPRNRQQRDALRVLTEFTFLPNDWSLKSVLKRILASRWIGRRAPTISQADSAYVLPMVLDPWVQADPSEVPFPPPHEKANGQGEMVNLYRVNTVLRNIAGALGWKEPRRFPDNDYPSPLDQNLGQYLSPGIPGFSGINFQSLLALEDEVGLCEKSDHAADTSDWIDFLVDEIETFNTANADKPLTIGDVWEVVKDRMIQDTTIEHELPSGLVSEAGAKTEAEALVALINQGLGTSLTLNSSATELSSANLNDKLREACGVLVKSPEFLLTNITPRGYSDNNMPDPPRITVCMEGESCGYIPACVKWRSKLYQMGKYTACEDRSVRESIALILVPLPHDLVFQLVNQRFERICPSVICGFIERPPVGPCLRNPEFCPDPIPPIPPRFADFMGQTPVDLHEPGMLVLNANGAVVTDTQGARYRPVGERVWQPLSAETTLRTGDLLYVPLTAALHINLDGLEFGVDPLEETEIEGVSAHLISITGDNAISVIDRYFAVDGALGLAELIEAEQTGTFETRGVSEDDWEVIIGYGATAESQFTPTPEEVAEMNADFEALHQGFGTDDGEPAPPGEKPSPDDREDPTILLLLLVVAMLVIVIVVISRRR